MLEGSCAGKGAFTPFVAVKDTRLPKPSHLRVAPVVYWVQVAPLTHDEYLG
jgi:hypothetical protein